MRIAEATYQPVEVLVAQSVMSNLLHTVDNASPELESELLRQNLTNEALLAIAFSNSEAPVQAQVELGQPERQTELLAKSE